MKKQLLTTVLFVFTAMVSVLAQPYYLRGEVSPCDWGNSSTGCELTDPDSNGVFEVTIDLGPAPGIGYKEFKVHDAGTGNWYPGYANAWYRHKGGSVTFRYRPSIYQVEAKDATVTSMCAPGAFSDWNNATPMVKAGNVYCYTIANPGTYEWKPTMCGEWKSWQPCDGLGERSTNSNNWSVTTTIANEQVCVTYNPTTGKVTPNSKLVVTGGVTSLACNGAGAVGAINLTVTGGVGPANFAWSNEANTEDLTGLMPGSYTVTITKDGFCPLVRTYTVKEPTAVSFTKSIQATSATKFKVTIVGSGGTPINATSPYRYRRSTSTGYTTWTVNPVFSNLSAGTYTFEMKDKNNCTTSQTFYVGVSNLMIAPDLNGQFGGIAPEAAVEINPNPAIDFINVRIEGLDDMSGVITVTDILGRTVLTQTTTAHADNIIRLSLNDLRAGSYCLYFRAQDGTLVNKCFVVGR